MADQGKEIPIDKLTQEQLGYVKKQIDTEIQTLSGSFTSLKIAYQKFQDNKAYVKQLKETKEREILVPLTSSIYVTGKTADIDSVTIELGANYFVKTKLSKAEGFCQRKLDLIAQNMDRLDEMIRQKSSSIQVIDKQILANSTKKMW